MAEPTDGAGVFTTELATPPLVVLWAASFVLGVAFLGTALSNDPMVVRISAGGLACAMLAGCSAFNAELLARGLSR